MLQHALAIILLIWPVIRALHAIVLLPDRIRTDAERLRTERARLRARRAGHELERARLVSAGVEPLRRP